MGDGDNVFIAKVRDIYVITKYDAEVVTGVESLTFNHQFVCYEISSYFGDEQVVVVLFPARRCGFRDRRGERRGVGAAPRRLLRVLRGRSEAQAGARAGLTREGGSCSSF